MRADRAKKIQGIDLKSKTPARTDRSRQQKAVNLDSRFLRSSRNVRDCAIFATFWASNINGLDLNTKFAKSSALEKNGLREKNFGGFGGVPVVSYLRKRQQILGF